MAKPAAIEARKAKAIEDLAERLSSVETKLDLVVAKLYPSETAPEEPQVETPVEPEAGTTPEVKEATSEAPIEPPKPGNRRNK